MMRSCREELNCRNHHPINSSFMTYHRCVTRVTRRVPHMGHEQLTLPVNLSSPSAFSGVLVARSLAFSVVFCMYQCLSFFFWPSSIYGFWLPLWYHQTFLCNHATAEKMNGVILDPDSIYPIILVEIDCLKNHNVKYGVLFDENTVLNKSLSCTWHFNENDYQNIWRSNALVLSHDR